MSLEFFTSRYSRSLSHFLYSDVVPAYIYLRSAYDPCPLGTDINAFQASIEWWHNDPTDFRHEVKRKSFLSPTYFGYHMATLAMIDV